MVRGVDWKARPSAADVAAAYPAKARAAGVSGRVVLTCDTGADGGLSNCRTRGETPAGVGFAEAALQLAPKFRVNAVFPEGVRVRTGKVSVPIIFGTPAVAPTPPTPVVGRPVWISRPTAADVIAVYPEEAYKAGRTGRVVLRCKTTSAGDLVDCETRGDADFAKAALKLARKFKVKPVTPDGSPAGGGYINVPILFGSPTPAPTPRAAR